MDTLPPEILAEIVRLACTDGGRTARALQLVSRVLGAIARRGRLRAVVAVGNGALEQLAHAASSPSAGIAHLFVTDRVHVVPRRVLTLSLHGDAATDVPHWTEAVREREAERTLLLVPALIAPASPQLRTLYLQLENSSQHAAFLASVTATSFPRLTDLALCYPLKASYQAQLPPRLDMPVLRSLAFVSKPLSFAPQGILAHFHALCPSLEHVHLHGTIPSGSLWRFMAEITSVMEAQKRSYSGAHWTDLHIHIHLLLVPSADDSGRLDPQLRESVLRRVHTWRDVKRMHLDLPLDARQVPFAEEWLSKWQDVVQNDTWSTSV
jgi:hypothetical protein